jgi:hypothetical protein
MSVTPYYFLDEEIPVFGIFGFDDNGCHCGNPECKAVGKHPIASNWQHTPIWSEEQLEVIELSGQFDSGYGVLVNGLLIVDIDSRNGGVKSFEKLCADLEMDLLGMAGLAVATGSGQGSMHLYFKAPKGVPMVQHHKEYDGIDFKSSGYVVGPGSLHASGNSYTVIHGEPSEIELAPTKLIELLKKPETYRAEYKGEPLDVTDSDIESMLSYVDPDCDHETWYRCGMAIHHSTQGAGFALWDDWSKNGKKYPGISTLEKRWHSFGKSNSPVTIATLLHYAEDGGYQQSVTFTPTVDFIYDEQAPDGLPFSIDGIDLLRPPGFVGEVTKWINQQSRYPRENLSVAAALTAIGNVVGLRYTDDLDNVNANLFCFCVAGSGTGKEAVQQAQAAVHRAAGIHGATHGAIKSEQEIIRNLIRNQMAAYIIDEVGIFLKKISNAQKSGGAAYLDGVIGMLMSAYSKADGFMLLTGDTKDEVQKAMMQELAQCRKAVSENEDKTGAYQRRIPQLERSLEQIDNGLERPFLSMIGYTTPVTFDGLITFEQATNGFIGRSLLINERETNPRAKRRFKKSPMPESMEYTLKALYSGGSFDQQCNRVEYYGERIKIRTDAEAAKMLDDALDWIENEAEAHKERTGLESVVRRGYEIMAKISLILAVPSGVRTAEHVRWAFAMMKRDIDEKTRLAFANERQKDDPTQAMAAKILNLIDREHGETKAVIQNRLRPAKKDDVEKVIAMMIENKLIIEKEVKASNGRASKKFYAC